MKAYIQWIVVPITCVLLLLLPWAVERFDVRPKPSPAVVLVAPRQRVVAYNCLPPTATETLCFDAHGRMFRIERRVLGPFVAIVRLEDIPKEDTQ